MNLGDVDDKIGRYARQVYFRLQLRIPPQEGVCAPADEEAKGNRIQPFCCGLQLSGFEGVFDGGFPFFVFGVPESGARVKAQLQRRVGLGKPFLQKLGEELVIAVTARGAMVISDDEEIPCFQVAQPRLRVPDFQHSVTKVCAERIQDGGRKEKFSNVIWLLGHDFISQEFIQLVTRATEAW